MTEHATSSTSRQSIITTADRVFDAARKIESTNAHHPVHLGGCIGPLSDVKCRCGVTDLMYAIRAYDKSIIDTAEALSRSKVVVTWPNGTKVEVRRETDEEAEARRG